MAFASESAQAASADLQPDLSAHYSCGAGTQLVFDHDDPVCWDGTTDGSGAPYLGQYWVCGADAYPSDPGTCSDGSIPMLENSTTLAMYHATPITVFVAQEVHLLTAEELAALDAQLASWPLPSWASGPLNADQAAAVNETYASLQGFYAR